MTDKATKTMKNWAKINIRDGIRYLLNHGWTQANIRTLTDNVLDEGKDEADTRFSCPKCGYLTGPDDIDGCETLRCPKCGTVFEPVEGEV